MIWYEQKVRDCMGCVCVGCSFSCSQEALGYIRKELAHGTGVLLNWKNNCGSGAAIAIASVISESWLALYDIEKGNRKHVFSTNCGNMWHVFVWMVLNSGRRSRFGWSTEACEWIASMRQRRDTRTETTVSKPISYRPVKKWANWSEGKKSKHHKENVNNHTGYRWL